METLILKNYHVGDVLILCEELKISLERYFVLEQINDDVYKIIGVK